MPVKAKAPESQYVALLVPMTVLQVKGLKESQGVKELLLQMNPTIPGGSSGRVPAAARPPAASPLTTTASLEGEAAATSISSSAATTELRAIPGFRTRKQPSQMAITGQIPTARD